MVKSFKISKFNIDDKNIFIIAEIGVNHNGNLKVAKKLISEAKKAGANCVKFQTYEPNNLVDKNALKAKYQQKNTKDKKETQYEMLEKLKLTKDDHVELVKFCKKKNIIFLSTPYNFSDADFLHKINVPAFKLSSMHLTEYKFIEYVSLKKKPIIISTGMASEKDVSKAVKILKKNLGNKFILMQCTTDYPTKIEDANIKVIKNFKQKFNCHVGYSDHTMGVLATLLSLPLGIVAIEKHFTLNKQMKGPDHKCSLEPNEFKKLIDKIKVAKSLLGSEKKKISYAEKINSKIMKRSLYTKKRILKNNKITFFDLEFKRPLNGIPASFAEKVIGRIAKKKIEKNTKLNWNHFK